MYDYLRSVFNWTLRKGTRAAAHIPDDSDEVCERAVTAGQYGSNYTPWLMNNLRQSWTKIRGERETSSLIESPGVDDLEN